MLFKCFEEIKFSDMAYVAGGACHCSCERKIEDGFDIVDIGKAKTLEECSNVCLANGWKIASCDTIANKKNKDDE